MKLQKASVKEPSDISPKNSAEPETPVTTVSFPFGILTFSGFTVWIRGLYIDDFEEQLIGAHPGDSVEVNVTFPDDYQQEDLQGKDALSQVTINGIYEN